MNKYTYGHFITSGCFKYKEWKICDIKIIRYIYNYFYTIILYLAFCFIFISCFLTRNAEMMDYKYLNIYFGLITYFLFFVVFDFLFFAYYLFSYYLLSFIPKIFLILLIIMKRYIINIKSN